MNIKSKALDYIASGLNVLSTKEDKRPAFAWKHLQSQMISESEINKFDKGIAVVCGSISGNLEVLDFDNHQNTAKEILTEFFSIPEIKELNEKHNFCIERSKGKGYHVFYRCDKIGGNQKLASIPKKQGDKWVPDAIIETRGEGGYVIVAPTDGYSVIRGSFELINTITPKERDTLIQHAKTFNKWNNDGYTQFEESEKPGDVYNNDFNSIYEAKSLLQSNGWVNVNGKNWRRPGKRDGISATFGIVADNVFYNFSANGHPFQENKSYTPFQILAFLKFDGDFSKTAKYLAEHYGMYSEIKQQPDRKEKNEHKKEEKTSISKLDAIFTKTKIDFNKEYEAPTPILSIVKKVDSFAPSPEFIRLFTPANISVISGKAKSKKTFFQSMLAGSLNGGAFSERFKPNISKEKSNIITFDTEQGIYDVAKVANRVKTMASGRIANFHTFGLRGLDYNVMIDFIEYVIYTKIKNTSIIFIDQVADLMRSINDEVEAVALGKKFEKWTAELDLHICCGIHQNKGNDFATGWLGSQLMKKSETVIKITRDATDSNVSYVEPDLTRGEEFEPFAFRINRQGMPEIIGSEELKSYDTSAPF